MLGAMTTLNAVDVHILHKQYPVTGPQQMEPIINTFEADQARRFPTSSSAVLSAKLVRLICVEVRATIRVRLNQTNEPFLM